VAFFPFEIGGCNLNYLEMDGCIELTNPTDPNTSYFMKEGVIVARRVMSIERGHGIERWYKGDKRHRDGDLPAMIYYNNGQKTSEHWFKDDNLHRDGDLPVEIYYENGQKTIERWFKNGRQDRDGDLPAEIWYKNGQKTEEHWYKDGRRCTPAQPSPAKDETSKLAKIKTMLTAILAELAD
jgi:hypothetical protein